jgi:hypothetical protein
LLTALFPRHLTVTFSRISIVTVSLVAIWEQRRCGSFIDHSKASRSFKRLRSEQASQP